MIHGHIHNNREALYFPIIQKTPNLLNAGVEINNYQPVRLDDLIKNNDVFKSVAPYRNERHGSYMSESELKRYIERIEKIVEEESKTMTKEKAREALIRTGILDEQGNVTERYRRIFVDVDNSSEFPNCSTNDI